MSDPTNDLAQLKAALDQIGNRLATDPEYRDQLRDSELQAAALHSAGVSAALLAGVLEDAGAEESEVAAFGMGDIKPTTGPDVSAIKVNTNCVTPGIGSGSCRRLTLSITISTNPPQS